jgi:type IV pilus assembly protein PilE
MVELAYSNQPRGMEMRQRTQLNRHNKHQGFTLIEVMIVIVILSILVGIAYPAYQDYVRKARRADAKATVAAVAAAQEQYFLSYKSYTTSNFGNPTSEGGHYTISVDYVPGTSTREYTVNAIPVGGQLQDGCKTFTLDQTGLKGVAAVGADAPTETADDCW